MNRGALLLFIGNAVIFLTALSGAIWWDRRKRRTRPPFPQNLRLLRMPGEWLWRRVIENDEAIMQSILAAMLVPILFGTGLLYVIERYLRFSQVIGLLACLIGFAFCMFVCVHWIQRRLQTRANHYLGFFGERYVAEWLDSLKQRGWFIFHDVGCEGVTAKFNLDHVAVGPGGVWVIETKTCRKGRTRPNFKADQVIFDGKQIILPWGEDTKSLKQATNNA